MIIVRFFTTAIVLLILSSCNMASTVNFSKQQSNAAIENKIATMRQAKLSRDYKNCINDGRNLDNLAAKDMNNSLSLYHKSAQILVKCSNYLKKQIHFISKDVEMKNFALGIQNFVKSGDLVNARINFEIFKKEFDKDLMFLDGSSFISNMELLLNYKNPKDELNLAMINANNRLKTELKRAWHWSKK